MTEEEAREKWCPFVRYASHNGESINRWARDGEVQMSPEPAKCIASACMAWRWIPVQETQAKLVAIRDYRDQHDTDLVTAKNAVEAAWAQGFCGLAGAPQ